MTIRVISWAFSKVKPFIKWTTAEWTEHPIKTTSACKEKCDIYSTDNWFFYVFLFKRKKTKCHLVDGPHMQIQCECCRSVMKCPLLFTLIEKHKRAAAHTLVLVKKRLHSAVKRILNDWEVKTFWNKPQTNTIKNTKICSAHGQRLWIDFQCVWVSSTAVLSIMFKHL